MDAVVRQDLVDVVEVIPPRHHYGEIPVVEGQSLGHGKCLPPGLSARDDRWGTDEVLLEQSGELVALEVTTAMHPINPFGGDHAGIVDQRDIAINQADIRVEPEDGQNLTQVVGPVAVVTVNARDECSSRQPEPVGDRRNMSLVDRVAYEL